VQGRPAEAAGDCVEWWQGRPLDRGSIAETVCRLTRVIRTMRLPGYGIAVLLVLHVALAGEVYFNDFNGPLGSPIPSGPRPASGIPLTQPPPYPAAAAHNPFRTPIPPTPPALPRRVRGANPTRAALRPAAFCRRNPNRHAHLPNLTPHSTARVEFDLYVLKSWDGKNPNYGPDRWSLRVRALHTTRRRILQQFQDTPYDLSLQDYPTPAARPVRRHRGEHTRLQILRR